MQKHFIEEIDLYVQQARDTELANYWQTLRPLLCQSDGDTCAISDENDLSSINLNTHNNHFSELFKTESDMMVLVFDILSIFGNIISQHEIQEYLNEFLSKRLEYNSGILSIQKPGSKKLNKIWDFGLDHSFSKRNVGNLSYKIANDDLSQKIQYEAAKIGNTYYLENANSCKLPISVELDPDNLYWGADDLLCIWVESDQKNETIYLFLDKKPGAPKPGTKDLALLELLLTSVYRAMKTSSIYDSITLELKRNRFLFEITNLLNSDFEFQYCLNEVLQKMQAAFGYLWIGFWIFDIKDKEHLHILSQAGEVDEYFEGIKLEKGEKGGIVGMVAENGHFFIINEPDSFQKDKLTNVEGSNSQLAVPVIKNDVIFGVLDIRSSETNAFDQKSRRFARIVANQLAQSYASRRNIVKRVKELKIRRSIIDVGRIISSILDLDILMKKSLQILLRTFNYWGAAIFLTTANGKKLYLAEQAGEVLLNSKKKYFIAGKEGIVGIAASTKMITNIPDVHQFPFYIKGIKKVNSEIAIPIMKHNVVIGVLDVYSTDYHAFSTEDEEILELFANYMSVAIVNARYHRRVQELAIRDGLTSLYNHRNFMESIAREHKIAERYNKPYALLMMDIDFFKSFNDNYGHPAGDKVLREAAKTIRSNIRQDIDIAARYGGEEFAVLLLETKPKQAYIIAERIRESFSQIKIQGIDTEMTISIGIASYPKDADNPKDIIEKSDTALYQAKKAGRNRTIMFNQEEYVAT